MNKLSIADDVTSKELTRHPDKPEQINKTTDAKQIAGTIRPTKLLVHSASVSFPNSFNPSSRNVDNPKTGAKTGDCLSCM